MPVIAISGSYGGLNLGDEAILTCMLQELRAGVPGAEIVVFSRDAAHTTRHHRAERVVPVRELTREQVTPHIPRLDLLLLGGGGILYDREARVYLREVQIAQELGVRTATYAVSAGPLETGEARQAVAETLNKMDAVTVREARAKRLLEEIGVTRDIVVTADPAVLLTPEPFTEGMLEREGVRKRRHLVGMSVREVGPAAPKLGEIAYHQLLATAADFVVDRLDADVLFVPLERGDIRESHAVIGRMAAAERASVLRGTSTLRQLLGLMEHLDAMVAMRLHCLIFAAIARIPFIALPYADKVGGFLEEVGLPARTLDETHPGPLLASIDRSWDERARLKAALDERLPALQQRARETTRIVLDLVRRPAPARGEPAPAAEAG